MWNDKETDIDLLGYDKLAETIVSIMNEQDLRPLTIGVYGQWGVGKSSVLSLINSRLSFDKETLCLNFNGWLFQGYEDTRSALMESVIGELMKLQPNDKKVLRLGKSLLKRINWLKVAKIGGSAALTALTGLPAGALWGIPGLLTRTKELLSGDKNKDAGSTIITVEEESDESLLKEAEETVPGQIHAFRQELKELIKSSKVYRVVVLVDELDRCLPAAVIDILEAIRLFLFVEGTVFVLAADEQMIEYAVRRHYPDLPVSQADYTKHYLEKLVQIPMRIPSLNQLQTKNYIKLLLLQYRLQTEKGKFETIVEAFEATKTTPYDNAEISFEFVTQQLQKDDAQIKQSLIVAEQLGAILSRELRGNPRNIKRFLNTIFLRQRVAVIYKIQDKIKLDALAKLLLLERFHDGEWEVVVGEVAGSQNGTSSLIKGLEEWNDGDPHNKKVLTQGKEAELKAWGKLSPLLKDMDLRPYLFVCREKAIGFTSADDVPYQLVPVFEVLSSGASISMAGKEPELKALSEEQAVVLFKLLIKSSHAVSNWDNPPPSMKGAMYLMQKQPLLEERLVQALDNVLSKDFKPWMISNLTGFKTDGGKAAKKALLDRLIANPETMQTIKKLAQQIHSK